jgi:hypothetical protein
MVDRKVIIFSIFIAFLIFPNLAYADNWWNSSWHMRIPINISYTLDMENASVKVNINFTQLINELNISGTFDQNSIRVVETTEDIPYDFENETYDTGNVSWIANGTTLANTNRTFWIYFDIIENGAKTRGKIISEKPYWESGYDDTIAMDVWSNQTTSPGVGYEWNRSWAESVEVSWRWCTEAGFDYAYLYVDGLQVRRNDGTGGSETALFQGNRISSRFTSDAGGKPATCGNYGAAVDWLKFYPTANYSTPPLTTSQGDPELQPLSITVGTDKSSYNYNETVFISGIVKDANNFGVNASSVDLRVFFPNGTEAYSNTLQTNSSGYYNDSLTIVWEDTGTYTINVTVYKFSYSNGTNTTTFYYTANREPLLENASVSPNLGGWGENFTYSIDVYDFEGDEVNVTLWTNENGVWTKHETKSINPPGNLSWTISPFSCSDVGLTRSYKFEYRDGNHTWKNTTEHSGPTVEKDDISLEYLMGNNTTVNREGDYNITLGVRFKDIDRNQYISGETVEFWVFYSGMWNAAGSSVSGTDGNVTIDFNPNCSVEVGTHNWKANYSNTCYKNNESKTFSFNVTGQLKNYLELPTNGSTYYQGDIITIRGNVTDECSVPISNANVNFTLIVDSTQYYCGVNNEGSGYYNCSWDSFAKTVGNYSIRVNSTKVNYNFNETLWVNRFELLPGPPRVIINISPEQFGQLGNTEINATVLDQSGTGIQWVKINVTRPNGTIDNASMVQVESSVWSINYNNTWGNTSSRGLYNVTVYAADNNGNIGSSNDSFKVYANLTISLYSGSNYYYQGETGSIFYQVNDTNGNNLKNVNVTFIIKDPNRWKIFNSSYSSDVEGKIYTLFTIPSDAVLGNYTLEAFSSYYDNQVNILVNKNSTYNFTVYEKTAAEFLTLTLEAPSAVEVSKDLEVSATVTSGTRNVNVDSALASLYDPLDNLIVQNISMNNTAQGVYNAKYTTSTSSTQGNWKWVVIVTSAGDFLIKEIFTRLVGGPFDVKNINVIDSTIPDLSISVDIENTGNAGQDVTVEWNLTRTDTGESLDSGADTIYIEASSTKTYTVTPTTNYIGNVKISFMVYYSGTERAGAYETFTTSEEIAPTAPAAAPTGFFAPPKVTPPAPTPEIEITNYSEEVLIEKGWIKYISFIVKNTGGKDVHNLYIYIGGEFPEWFKVQTNKTDILPVGETSEFIVKVVVPMSAEAGVYSFYVNARSDEVSDKKSFIVRVFSSRAELLLYQIQVLREKVDKLEEKMRKAEREGKDVSLIRDMIDEARSKLNSAEGYIYRKGYDKAIEIIRDVEDLTKEIEYEISIAPPLKPSPVLIPVEWLIILILLTIVFILIIYNVFRRKAQPKIKPEISLKEMIVGKEKIDKVSKELEELREAYSLIEEEFKEGLLSEESYEELKSKYEEKISLLENKLKEKEIKGKKK